MRAHLPVGCVCKREALWVHMHPAVPMLMDRAIASNPAWHRQVWLQRRESTWSQQVANSPQVSTLQLQITCTHAIDCQN